MKLTRRETVRAEAHGVWSSSSRVYTRRSQNPHRQGQTLDENEKDMYGFPEVITSKCLESAGHLPSACLHNGQDFGLLLGALGCGGDLQERRGGNCPSVRLSGGGGT